MFLPILSIKILGDVEAPVPKSVPIDKPHFETTQGILSTSFHNPEFWRLLIYSFYSKFVDTRSHNGGLIPFFHADTPFYVSFSGGCRNSDTDFFSIHFLSNTLTE